MLTSKDLYEVADYLDIALHDYYPDGVQGLQTKLLQVLRDPNTVWRMKALKESRTNPKAMKKWLAYASTVKQ